MQVALDSKELGKETKNEPQKKIIFIKIPTVLNDNGDNNNNNHIHMQSQQSQQQQRFNNKTRKTVIPYEKPPAVFTANEKPFTELTSDKNLIAPHNSAGTVYKSQPLNEDESSSNMPSALNDNNTNNNQPQMKHVLSLDDNDELNSKPHLNENNDDPAQNILDNISCSLVWTSIPVLSYVFPFVGHVGITDSVGRIHDFGSSNYVSIDQMAYGNPDKIIHFEITQDEFTRWNKSIHTVSKKFSKKTYSLCGTNGYSFCASVLNKIKYNDRNDYTACEVMKMTIGCSYYVSTASMCKSYIGLIVIIVILIIIIILCTS